MVNVAMWRTKLQAGSWFYASDYHGRLNGQWWIQKPGQPKITVEVVSKSWHPWWWDMDFHAAANIPVGTAPGLYVFSTTAGVLGQVEVLPTPLKPKKITIQPSGFIDTLTIEQALSHGDVVLVNGTYYIDRAINLNNTLSCNGSTIIRLPGGNDYRNAMFRPINNCTVENAILKPLVAGWVYTGTGQEAINVTLRQSTIFDGILGWFEPCDGFLVEDVLFKHSSVAPTKGGCYRRCKFEGLGPDHSFLCEGANSTLIVLDCVFDGTDRGMNFRHGWGDSTGILVDGVVFKNINTTPNGNETPFNFEAGNKSFEIHNNLFLHTRTSDCHGALTLWDANVVNNKFTDHTLIGSSGIMLAAVNGARQEGNEFSHIFLEGGPVSLAVNTKNNLFNTFAGSYRPIRDNEGGNNPLTIPPAMFVSSGPDCYTNRLTNSQAFGAPLRVDYPAATA